MSTGSPGDDVLQPDFEETVNELAKLATAKMAIGAIARVESYSNTTQTCSCRPVVRGSLKDAGAFQYPVLTNIPVRFPGGGDFSITWPLKAGDFVWLDFADRSIDEWADLGGSDVAPNSKRRFDLSDAVAYATIRPRSAPLQLADTDELVIGQDGYDGPISNNGSIVAPLQLRIGPDGIRLGDGGSTNDVLAILSGLLQLIAADTNVLASTSAGAAALDLLLDGIRNP